jgi:hypothetical protein
MMTQSSSATSQPWAIICQPYRLSICGIRAIRVKVFPLKGVRVFGEGSRLKNYLRFIPSPA